jgi:hypothetical protein
MVKPVQSKVYRLYWLAAASGLAMTELVIARRYDEAIQSSAQWQNPCSPKASRLYWLAAAFGLAMTKQSSRVEITEHECIKSLTALLGRHGLWPRDDGTCHGEERRRSHPVPVLNRYATLSSNQPVLLIASGSATTRISLVNQNKTFTNPAGKSHAA